MLVRLQGVMIDHPYTREVAGCNGRLGDRAAFVAGLNGAARLTFDTGVGDAFDRDALECEGEDQNRSGDRRRIDLPRKTGHEKR